MALSVIGAGFGRTGTLSLKLALEKLGVGPCYHMLEVRQNPEHAAVWSRAADGHETDWDTLFEGYSAAVDWPACHFWRELARHYSESAVLLTVRDPERWYRSARDTIYRAMQRAEEAEDPVARDQLSMARKIVLEQTFGGRFEDEEHAIAVYERHNEVVRRSVPAHRLLAYRVAEGWAPLCDFLDREVPDEPFPHVNTTEEFRRRMSAPPRP